MLPARNRLRRTREIDRVFKEGQGLVEGPLFLKSAKNGLDVTRFAFVVSRKTAQKASDRNRIKRVLREEVKKSLTTVKTGLDCTLVARSMRGLQDSRSAREVVKSLFKKAKLLI